MFKRILSYVLHLVYAEVVDGKRMFCGMLPHKEDERDFMFGWTYKDAYKPLYDKWEVKTLGVKDQGDLNVCTFMSAALQREVDEKIPLSVPFLVSMAKSEGRIEGNGFSTIRDAQKVVMDHGICEQSLCTPYQPTWNSFSSNQNLTYDALTDAAKRKSKDVVWLSNSQDDYLRAIDEGHAIQTGMMWYSGYNMNGGLTYPYVLQIGRGTAVGGHSVTMIGYDMKKGLYKLQNSYGEKWGDNGCFYIRMLDWHTMGNASCISHQYLDRSTLAKQYEGKDVKADANPGIWRIENGVKRVYLNQESFFNQGGTFTPPSYLRVARSILDALPDGIPMP
jgi:hypothetical protein